MSARGLAIGTGEPEGEEFPFFRAHWIEAPSGDRMVVHSLLDGPSATGAYRFTIRPGDETTIDVEATIFVRAGDRPPRPRAADLDVPVRRQGPQRARRLPPGVHDSDGLAMWNGSRRAALAAAAFAAAAADQRLLRFRAARLRPDPARAPLQRVRGPRTPASTGGPSVWVEPIGDWGRGHVVLVEIPTDRGGPRQHRRLLAPDRPDAGGQRDVADLPPALGLGRARRRRAAARRAHPERCRPGRPPHASSSTSPATAQPVVKPSAVQLSAQANPGIAARRGDLREPGGRRPAPALRPRPGRQRPGRAAHRPSLGRAPDRRDLGVPMESVTLTLPTRLAGRPAGAAAAVGAARHARAEPDRASTAPAATACPASRAPGSPAPSWWLGALLLTALLVWQMWLVLSVGGLTGVEKAMLGLFVVNIAWIGLGAVSPLLGFLLGPERAAPPDAPPSGPHRAPDADLQRGPGAHRRRRLRHAPRDRRPRRRRRLRPLHPQRHQPPRRLARRAGDGRRRPRRPRDRAAALLPPSRPQPAPQGRQHRRLGRALGRRLPVHAGARRRQPDGRRHHHRARPPHGGRRRPSASCRPRRT